MLANQRIFEITKEFVKDLIINRDYKEPPFSPLNIIIGNERKVHSKVHGLFTAYGNFWEKLSKKLAGENEFEVLDHKIFKKPGNAPIHHENTLTQIITSRENEENEYDAHSSKEAIRLFCQYYVEHIPQKWKKAVKGTGVDVYLKKNDVHYLFDTKTVQPNIANCKTFLSQLHHWYWYFYSQFPNDKLFARIIFPYNPYSSPFEKNIMNGGRPVEHITEWLGGEYFWSLLTDNTDAYDQIILAHNEVADDPDVNEFLITAFPETRL